MTEQIWLAVITASAALLGSIAGYVASTIQTTISWQRQLNLEEKKRNWAVEDATQQHRIGVLMKRIDQVEEFVYYYTEDFQNIRHAAIFILRTNDLSAIEVRMAQYAAWKDQLPKRVYGYGPGIVSLGRKILVKYWDRMNKQFEELGKVYSEICDNKTKNPLSPLNQEELLAKIDYAYQEFNEGLGQFISELDNARALAPMAEMPKE
jgi:ribosomal protein S17E